MNEQSPDLGLHRSVETQLGGIVPPFMEDGWRRLRGHLRAAADLANHAADASTTEEARKFVGLASSHVMDASFWLLHLERESENTPLDGIDE
jgi:hypothetical protein